MSEPDFDDCLRHAWTSGQNSNNSDPIVNITGKLKHCSLHLSKWKKSLGSSISSKIRDIQSNLKNVQSYTHPTDYHLQLGRQLENELDSLLYKEEEYLKQRSRVNWLRLWDKNTRYFHQFASSRRAKNQIISLLRPDGSMATDTDAFVSTIEKYFDQLFASHNPDKELIDRILSGITNRISESEVESPNCPYTDNEIKRAAFQLANDKAPGSDGFNGTFFQKTGI
uniref:Reverse transcriptase n=1 Tax=Cannabis sativa TaxID=3483 RepID=A0A803QDA4_CANSA